MEIRWRAEDVEHMLQRHRITAAEAEEAVNDEAVLWENPDPASRSGLTLRATGYSQSAKAVLCVILHQDGDMYEGINAWPANETYRRIYREGERP